ncbi:MAG: substrate-binding domain-containing protein [Spirochaetota bacterium]|nr:MAG: substrate-binding domain-containing protein [Spirochaetota bacterium]
MKKLILILLAIFMVASFTLLWASDEEAEEEEVEHTYSHWGTVTLEEFYTKSPDGIRASKARLDLSEAEKQTIRDANLEVAWILSDLGEWARGIVRGSKMAMDDLGMKLVIQDVADWNPAVQIAAAEAAMSAEVDIIIAMLSDPVGEGEVFRRVADQGIICTFVDEIPAGFKHPEDYAGVVTADLVELGTVVAELMADAVDGEGKVGLLYLDFLLYNANTRCHAAVLTLKSKYPKIKLLQKGIVTPEDAEQAAAAWITQHPDIKGIIAPYDTPAVSVISACKAADRRDIKIVSYDLGVLTALDMLQGGNVFGLGVESTAELGRTAVMMAAYDYLGKEVPYFLTVPAYPITPENVVELWEPTVGIPPPPEIAEFAK